MAILFVHCHESSFDGKRSLRKEKANYDQVPRATCLPRRCATVLAASATASATAPRPGTDEITASATTSTASSVNASAANGHATVVVNSTANTSVTETAMSSNSSAATTNYRCHQIGSEGDTAQGIDCTGGPIPESGPIFLTDVTIQQANYLPPPNLPYYFRCATAVVTREGFNPQLRYDVVRGSGCVRVEGYGPR
ncbi:hypothetical protein ABTX35_30630 [Streptomyces sp. NPDC096080]|uniref:hypothetical protein n=1 Tax=Streptomyces sp. NPDC096080 TaxID=3156693 RepID=UPI0033179150